MPINPNIAQSNNFKFLMAQDEKNIQFSVTEISGLGFNISEIDFPYHSINIKRAGDTVTFNSLSLTVLLDSDLQVLEQIHNYMDTIKDTDNNVKNDEYVFEGYLTLFDGMNYPTMKYTLHNCWISSMGDMTLSTTTTEAEPITLNVNVAYDWHELERVV